MLEENRERLEAIVKALLTKETLDEAQTYAAAGIERVKPQRLLVGSERAAALSDDGGTEQTTSSG